MDLLVEQRYRSSKIRLRKTRVDTSLYIALSYHDIFDYPLTKKEVWRFVPGEKLIEDFKIPNEIYLNLIKGNLIMGSGRRKYLKKMMNKETSKRKMVLAKKVARRLAFLPTVKLVGVTGSLAMGNAKVDSDIDLMIVTSESSLWISRIICYVILFIFGFKYRKYGNRIEEDKLCLNIWLTENNLEWEKTKRNVFTAHEIAAITPLVNKNNTYERFLRKNKWYREYWPKAASNFKLSNSNFESNSNFKFSNYVLNFLDLIAYTVQYIYMSKKITNEVVQRRRAIFHPYDWSSEVIERLKGYGYVGTT